MKGLGKVHPPDTKVLEDIWLSFYFGAKIGVLGLNGAGKSSLLRIMAGEDTSFLGEAFPAEGISVGFLQQEPRLDPAKTVLGNVEEGVAAIKALLTRYDEVNAKLGEDLSPEEMEKVLDEQSRIQDKIDASNAWDLDSRLELAMDALRLPPPDADVTHAVGRRAPPRRALPAAAAVARSAAARRADQPSRRRVGRLARALPEGLSGHRRRRHPRSLLPRQRRRLDSRARSRPRHSVGRQLLVVARAEAEPAGSRRRRRRPSASGRSSASSNGSACRRARGRRRARRVSTPTRSCCARRPRRRSRPPRSTSRPGPRLGDVVVEARHLRKGYGDNLLIEDLDFTLPRGGIVGVIGPNGAGKTTLFRMITGQEKPDAGTLKIGETVQIGYVDQSRDALDAEQDRLGGDLRRPRRDRARQAEGRVARLRLVVQLQGRRAAAQGRHAVGRRAQPRPPGEAAEEGQQPAAARRADQRSRRRHAARARRGAAQLRRLRRRHQPRSLVPRSHRHAHARLRGRQPGRVVRGQLSGLRGRPEAPPRRGRRSAAPDQVSEAHAKVGAWHVQKHQDAVQLRSAGD